MMSKLVVVKRVRIWDGVRAGLYDFSSAAMAAACGAAAEVPKKGVNAARSVDTPSAAAISGFCRTAPPEAEKLPGVIGVPSAWKKTWRGPSELDRKSTRLNSSH